MHKTTAFIGLFLFLTCLAESSVLDTVVYDFSDFKEQEFIVTLPPPAPADNTPEKHEDAKTATPTTAVKHDESKPSPPKATAKAEKHVEENKKKIEGDKCVFACEERITKLTEDFQAQIDQLNEKIADLENAQENVSAEIESISTQPSEELLANVNFLCVGTAYTFFTAAEDDNSTFGTVIDPVFLWRCGDDLLFEMKLDITLPDCRTDISLVYGTVDYVLNDCVTIRAGKYSLPLGLVWEKMTTGWINKLPNLPLPYNPRFAALLPAADVGIDIRGAFFSGYWLGWGWTDKIPAVITYDVWVGNGPSETLDGNIALDCAFDDNNYDKSFGARFGFRPQPFREIGFSGTRARWNNDSNAGIIIGKRHRYYNALVVDLNWRLTDNSKLMGEFIWTERDAKKNKNLGIRNKKVYQSGWWLQYSVFLGALGDRFCCTEHPFWERLEFVVRGGGVDSDIHHWSRQQISVGLNYYIKNILILKGSYDATRGRLLSENRGTIQLAVAY